MSDRPTLNDFSLDLREPVTVKTKRFIIFINNSNNSLYI